MKYPKVRELIEALRSLAGRPYTTEYPYRSHEPAKRFRDKPEYSDKGCVACGACSLVCPARAIEERNDVGPFRASRKMVLHLDECHYCGQCSALCTTRNDDPPGIKHTTQFDLAGFERSGMISETKEKELALCECCGGIITARAHLEWIAARLGPLAFSNPTVFIASLERLGVAEDVARAARDYALRSDRIKVLCAKCRRKATIEKF